jgi:hypothetical protein
MNAKFFKLVPATEEEVKGQPHVVVWNLKSEGYKVPGGKWTKVDWALHIQEGSAFVCNTDKLIKEHSPQG